MHGPDYIISFVRGATFYWFSHNFLSGGQLSQFQLDLNPAQVNEAENASFTVSFSNFATAPLGPGESVVVTVTVTAQRAQRNIGNSI